MDLSFVHIDRANQYIDDILSGRIIACDEVKWACLRQKRDLARQNTEGFPYVFDERRAELPCKFIEMFPHVKGIWKGKKFKLEPFQCFIVTTIFGWHDAENNRRRFNSCYCELPRKQGKSILAGGIALYCLMVDDLEPTPEIYIAATTLEQAGEVFEPCKEMIDSVPEIKKLFKVETYSKSISKSSVFSIPNEIKKRSIFVRELITQYPPI